MCLIKSKCLKELLIRIANTAVDAGVRLPY